MVGFSTLAPVLGFLLSVFTAVPAFAQDKIVLQLKWDHQAQFAGYYAALWQGFYADAGLDVEIRSAFQPGGRVLPATEVLEGRADFGIGAADPLLTINKGAPLIIASSVLQHSGFGIVTLEQSGISSPADLVGLRVATRESSVTRAELDAVLAAEGVDISLVKWVEVGAGEEAQLLSEGKINAYMGFWPASRWRLSELGFSPRFLRPAMYGVDFYGDAIFTTFRLADENPELVRRFVAASLQGWHFHVEHPEEVADRITSELVRALPVEDLRGFNRAMATEISNLTNHPIIVFGHSNPDRWSNMFNILGSAGLVDGQFKYLDYLFDPDLRAAQLRDRLVRWLAIAFAAAVVASGLILTWSWLLRRQVAVQTSEIVESERRYALAVAGTDAGIWDWNLRSGEVFRSRRWHEMLGYARTEVEPRVEAHADLLHPDDLTIAKSAMQSHLEERKRYDIEFRLRHKKGHYVWVHARGQAVWDEAGDPSRMAGSINEITDRKRAEEEIRNNAAITANSSDMVALLDMDCIYLAVNDAYLRPFGKTRDQVVGHSAAELFGETFFSEVIRPNADRCLRGEDVHYLDWRNFPATGKVYLDVTYTQFVGADGTKRGFVVSGREITDRFLADEKLHVATAQKSAILDQAGEAIITVDEDNLVPDLHRASHRHHVAQFLAATNPERTMSLPGRIAGLRKDGSEFPAEATISSFKSEGKRLGTVMIRDVSQRRPWEILPVGICYLDAHLRYVEINEWLAAVNGLPVEAHLGRTISEVIPDIASGALEQLQGVLETGEPVVNGSVVGETKADPGVAKTFRHNYRPVRSSSGAVIGVSCVVEDITEVAKAVADLELAHTELEQKVESRTAELNTALEHAQLANRAKTDFVANTSHELRTPLNAVIGFSEMLGSGIAGSLSAKQLEYVTDIRNSSSHLLSLINDILDLSKIEANAAEIAPEPLDLVSSMKYAMRLVADRAKLAGVDFISEIPGDLQGCWLIAE